MNLNVIGAIADIVTLLAALVTAFGIVSAFLTRPRPVVEASMLTRSAWVTIRLRKGMTPIRSVRMSWASIDDDEVAWSGDGDEHDGVGLCVELHPDQSFVVHVYEIGQTQFADAERENELRLGIRSERGFVMDLNWQRPFLPWLRAHRYVLWRVSDKAEGRAPTVLRRRTGKPVFLRVMQSSRRTVTSS